ncbi:hypothetical protein Peetri_00074 [Pseudomonas phage vB_PpuM-Peetri]
MAKATCYGICPQCGSDITKVNFREDVMTCLGGHQCKYAHMIGLAGVVDEPPTEELIKMAQEAHVLQPLSHFKRFYRRD